jgi:hypothetical protein
MRSIMKEQEVSQLICKDFLSDSESFRLLIYAIFLSFVGEALHDEESGNSNGLKLKHKLIESDLDTYRASGSCAILQLSEVCDDIAIGRYVGREYLSLANSILRYIINPREVIQKEVQL